MFAEILDDLTAVGVKRLQVFFNERFVIKLLPENRRQVERHARFGPE